MSLKEFLRKRLMLGSQYPSVEEEAENYINELKDELQRIYLIPDSDRDTWSADARKLWFDGFNRARETMLKFLRGKET